MSVRLHQTRRQRRRLSGLNTMISGIGVFYPDKRPTQRVGIVPDVDVRPTIAGIRAGRDEVLEEALRQILGRQTPADQIEKMARGPCPCPQRMSRAASYEEATD